MKVVRNKYRSRRLQKLFGISDDVDAFFYAAILRRFFHIITDNYASYHVLHHALDIYIAIGRNALCLSNDPSGNFVVQHVLKLHDLRCRLNVAVTSWPLR
ncbi:BnaCnng50930D [Brassica napus]|uniref:(rape) hypothetical protein n=1 Tax=Brassica napus TaxID=3708 RepID=A0A078JKY1_BRANA|nr:unnamed protein product [Brassica napus]CDY66451.1 BnaCnng50930D [Brassica napus]